MGNGHCYMQAQKDAYDEGVEDGRREGWREAYEAVIAQLDDLPSDDLIHPDYPGAFIAAVDLSDVENLIKNLRAERDSL